MTLPEGWETATIGDVTEPVSKRRPDEEPEREFTYIDISSIENQAIISPKRLLGSDAPSRARQVVKTRDTVLSTVRTYLKHTALVPEDLDDAVASTGFCVLRPAPAVNPKFLLFRVLEQKFVDDLSKKQRGSSYPAVRDADVREMPIDLPPLDEQQRIVSAIEEQSSRLDAGVFALERARKTLKAMRTSALEMAVTGKRSLRSPDGTDGEQLALGGRRVVLPEGWEWRPLRDLCTSISDGDHQPPPQTPDGVPFLVIGNVRTGSLDFSDSRHVPHSYYEALSTIRQPRDGDVLYTLVGSYGISVLVDDDTPFCVQRHIGILRPGPEVESAYLAAVLGSSGVYAQASNCATGTAQKTVPLSGLRRIEVPTPPLDVQRDIVRGLQDLDVVAEHLDKSLDVAKKRSFSLRSAILSAAFSGKLVRHVPNLHRRKPMQPARAERRRLADQALLDARSDVP